MSDRRTIGQRNAALKRRHGKGEEPRIARPVSTANYPTRSWWADGDFYGTAKQEYAERMRKGSGIVYTPTATGYDA